uniref:Uncharacterized protein n=1 Tax=Knipowitschia caucasica TaxID=637954 RepID=A0AAV2MLH6_KNICA
MKMEVQGPLVRRPAAFANEEQRVIHSWSRVSSAGDDVILDALHILSPKSRELSSTDDLLSFLQELRDEGHRPTILRSKDVYNYRSCMSLPLTQALLKQANKNARPAVKKKRKRPHRKRDVHPSWICERFHPRIQGVRPPEPRLNPRPVFVFSRSVPRGRDSPIQPCLRLTNIEGQSAYHTARLQIQPASSSALKPAAGLPPLLPALPPSGLPSQPLQNGVVALFSQKTQSCPASRSDGALIGDSAPVFDPQTHTQLQTRSNQWNRSNGVHRRRPKETFNGWREQDSRGLRARVIKVDESRSVAEARLKAQKILQVNLSPVIKIQPFHHILRDFRYLIK